MQLLKHIIIYLGVESIQQNKASVLNCFSIACRCCLNNHFYVRDVYKKFYLFCWYLATTCIF